MNATALRIALVVAVLMGSGGLTGMVLSEEDPSPGQHGTADDMFGQEGALPFGPVTLDDNAILMRVTNHHDEELVLSVSVHMEGPIRKGGGLLAEVYHGENGGDSLTQLIAGWAEGWEPGLVGARHGEHGASAPVSLRDVYDAADLFDADFSKTENVALEPGPHILILATSHWEAQWELSSPDALETAFGLEIIIEDPDMFRKGYSNNPGHWDEVHTEVYSRGGGLTQATTSIEIKYSSSMVYLAAPGQYNELYAKDGNGDICEVSGATLLLNPEASSIVAFLPEGGLTLEGLVISRYPPFLSYMVIDVPVEFERSPKCFG